ncbi:hypothetical protein [Nocardia arthritidis]|uniref:Uncharacterized protein n=1 Tax=Nocardia arthritidis TaxID=228602 RepID=A0A6G9Y4R7_9NOCA|nr:hypothetical protein [Nocardia arthritidis]QIS08192.1 hypothetical protein F5544_01335 [Nocardia arthritidis]
MISPDEEHPVEERKRQRGANFRAFVEVYRAAEANGPSAQPVSHAGWHPAARIMTSTAEGSVLVYHDSGDEGELRFGRDTRPMGTIMEGGFRRDFTRCPFAVVSVRPHGVLGVLASDVERLDVITADGATSCADIVAGTFAVTIDLDLPYERTIRRLRDVGASEAEMVDVLFGSDTRAEERAATRHLAVRAYDAKDALLYEGPVLGTD